MAVGSWQLAFGRWHLAVGSYPPPFSPLTSYLLCSLQYNNRRIVRRGGRADKCRKVRHDAGVNADCGLSSRSGKSRLEPTFLKLFVLGVDGFGNAVGIHR